MSAFSAPQTLQWDIIDDGKFVKTNANDEGPPGGYMLGVLALPHYPSQQRQQHTPPPNQTYSMNQFYYGQQSAAGPSQGAQAVQTQMYTPEHTLRSGYYHVIDTNTDSPQTSAMIVSSVRATDPRG